MNRKITFMALALLLCTGFMSSCKSDDEPAPVPEESLLIRAYVGTTIGSSQHFQDMPSTSSDTIYVTAGKANSTKFDIKYQSAFWGNATFETVGFKKVNGIYELDSTTGTFSMPQRTPGATEVKYKDYPATLRNSTIKLLTSDGRQCAFSFTIDVNLGERAGIYTLVLEQKQ